MTLMRYLLALALLPALMQQAVAAEAFPKRAVITMRGYWGFMPVGKAVLSWTQSDGKYHLENRMSGLGFTLRYVSDGIADEEMLKPTYYAEFRGRESSPKYESRFDWDRRTVSIGRPNEQKVVPIEGDIQDLNALSFDLAWRQGKPTTYAQLSNGRKLKRGPFSTAGEETMSVNGQSVKVIHLVSRLPKETVELWLAPSLHYLPLRIKYSGSEKIEMEAQKVEVDGRTALGG